MWRLNLEPLACPRPRIAVRGKFPTAYYPASYKTWKVEAEKQLRACAPETPLSCFLSVEAHFYVTRPRTSKLQHPKPDIDNYLKSLFDALTAAEWWDDDSQVLHVKASKSWSTEQAGYIAYNIKEIE